MFTICSLYVKFYVISQGVLFNNYSMKQPDLYDFEAIRMISQAQSNVV